MNNTDFKSWLTNKHIYSTPKQVTDCLSRVRRAERSLIASLGQEYDLDTQFSIDGGEHVRTLLSRRGRSDEMQKYKVEGLPIGTNQMDSIAAAVKKYFTFKSELAD